LQVGELTDLFNERRTMKFASRILVLVLGAYFGAIAQQPPVPPPQPATAPVVDAKLHASAVKLVGLMGSHKRIVDGLDKSLQDGKEKMLQITPGMSTEFADEWVRRMRVRTNVDDYVNVIVGVYEKHFNNQEMEELIQAQQDANDSKTPTLSPELKEKLSKENTAIISEVVGACGQIGAKLGAEVAQEIQKEHPEWVHETKPSGESQPQN
jgi:hypothetical protein